MALVSLLVLTLVTTRAAQAQTYNVLHSFSGGGDGGTPSAGLMMDRTGNLYGTAQYGGAGNGTVFKLSHPGSGWILSTLYAFQGGNDGLGPEARVLFGPDGGLYGTTTSGGFQGYGTVFELRPPVTACKSVVCPWMETVLYRFAGGTDGGEPSGDVIFDQSGNLYGTTGATVYELSPSNGGWTESVLYNFGFFDGSPYDGVVFDSLGNLYGTTPNGGNGECFRGVPCGTIFQLSRSGSTWVKSTLYNFQGTDDGGYPYAGLIFDNADNFYGASSCGGTRGGGAVFTLSGSDGSWTFTPIYGLGKGGCDPYFGGIPGPVAHLTRDSMGNLYGTARTDGAYGAGSVFKLMPSTGGWIYTDLHDFAGASDGAFPLGSVTLDASGNLFGTTVSGGDMSGNCNYYGVRGCGVVWEITR